MVFIFSIDSFSLHTVSAAIVVCIHPELMSADILIFFSFVSIVGWTISFLIPSLC